MTDKNKSVSNIGAKRRSLIMSAALKAFAQDGYKGASIQKIADAAQLPKANVLYYFSSKQSLYSEVMASILDMWNSSFDHVNEHDCPAESLAKYIADKMEVSRTNPFSSKVFAIEIINGGSNLDRSFKQQHKLWVQGRVEVIEKWIANGKLSEVDPQFLLYHIWSTTQHYADFSTQIRQLRGKAMTKQEFADATKTVIKLILHGCGLEVPVQYQLASS